MWWPRRSGYARWADLVWPERDETTRDAADLAAQWQVLSEPSQVLSVHRPLMTRGQQWRSRGLR